MATKGIDVSEHNGTLNWTKIKAAGIKFAILRAGYGRETSQKDAQFEANYKGAKAAGIQVGCYWYSYAEDNSDAKTEAKACLQCLKGKTFDLPVFYDIEESSQFNKGKSFCAGIAEAFCEAIKAGGFTPGLYMSRSPLQTYMTETVAKKYPLWVAEYSSQCNYDGSYVMWQYTDGGTISGHSCTFDMDYYYGGATSTSSTTTSSSTTTTKQSYILKSGLNTYSYKSVGDGLFSEHFAANEFACVNDSGVLQDDKFLVHSNLVKLLEQLYTKLKCSSMIITSGYRTPTFSVSIGGSATDQHTKGYAADIMCYDSNKKLIPSKTVCCTLEDMGHTGGCGYITETATHVDVRETYKAYFDEAMDGGATVFDSFYTHWGITKTTSSSTSTTTTTTTAKAKATVKTTAKLNLRSDSHTGADILKVIPKGASCSWYSDDGWGWSQVSYGGSTGWVINKCLSGKSGLSGYKTGKITGTNVRFRKTPDGTILDTLSKGKTFEVICTLPSGWMNVTYNSKNGYIKYDKSYIKVG